MLEGWGDKNNFSIIYVCIVMDVIYIFKIKCFFSTDDYIEYNIVLAGYIILLKA